MSKPLVDWSMPQPTESGRSLADVAAEMEKGAPWSDPAPRLPAPPEINPARRRRDSGLIVEPGESARALALLLNQEIGALVRDAIHAHTTNLRAKLRA